MSHRTITLSGGYNGGQVRLDGHDLSKAVRRVRIDVQAGYVPQVELDLAVDAIEVTSLSVRDPQFVVSMPDEAREALIQLGWTPPAGDAE